MVFSDKITLVVRPDGKIKFGEMPPRNGKATVGYI